MDNCSRTGVDVNRRVTGGCVFLKARHSVYIVNMAPTPSDKLECGQNLTKICEKL